MHFVIGGFQSGWTGGPYIGQLMADLMLGPRAGTPAV
jgi:glycine/D-amino acid oxidase-like deaminating enzyme